MGSNLSFRGWIVASLIRPNKLLYRILKPSARGVRRYVHPQSWLGGKIFSPFGVKISKTNYGGIPGVSFIPKSAKHNNAVIVFLHGGGYCFGSSLTTHRLGVALMAKHTGITCHSIDYRLAPEHPYPAALDDAMLAYQDIVSNNPTSRIILAGDSAGGGLAFFEMKLRDEGGRMPMTQCYSHLGLTLPVKANRLKQNQGDPMFTPSMPRDCSHYYAPEGIDMTNPYVSPAYGDFSACHAV